jgi:hypothetical protein
VMSRATGWVGECFNGDTYLMQDASQLRVPDMPWRNMLYYCLSRETDLMNLFVLVSMWWAYPTVVHQVHPDAPCWIVPQCSSRVGK